MFNTDYITESDLLILKQEYKYHKIIYIDFNNRQYVFRSLTKKEYADISSITTDEYTTEDLICQTALLYPDSEQYSIASCGHAGLPKKASELILEHSIIPSPKSLEEALNRQRAINNSINNQIIIIIKAAFPEYTIDDIENMTWEETIEKVVMAENIISIRDNNKDLKFNIAVPDKKETDEPEVNPMDDKNFISNLRKDGIDPVVYFGIQANVSEDLIQFPFIGGRHWNSEEILNEIRKEIYRIQSK